MGLPARTGTGGGRVQLHAPAAGGGGELPETDEDEEIGATDVGVRGGQGVAGAVAEAYRCRGTMPGRCGHNHTARSREGRGFLYVLLCLALAQLPHARCVINHLARVDAEALLLTY